MTKFNPLNKLELTANTDLVNKAKIRDSMVNELKESTHLYPLYFEDLIQ